MKEIHPIFGEFKKAYPNVYNAHEFLGKEIHEKAGSLPDTTRWLLKIAISAAGNHKIALETHILYHFAIKQ